MERIPGFIVEETTSNKHFIIVERDGPKMVCLNAIASLGCTYYAIQSPAWYNIMIAGVFTLVTIIWGIALYYIHTKPQKQKKQS